MNDGAANTATSMQDSAWSAVILKPIKALTPNPCDWDDSNDPYLDKMPGTLMPPTPHQDLQHMHMSQPPWP